MPGLRWMSMILNSEEKEKALGAPIQDGGHRYPEGGNAAVEKGSLFSMEKIGGTRAHAQTLSGF